MASFMIVISLWVSSIIPTKAALAEYLEIPQQNDVIAVYEYDVSSTELENQNALDMAVQSYLASKYVDRSTKALVYETELYGSKENKFVPIGYPANQPSGGISFSDGGSIYWQGGSNYTNIGVGVSVGYVSFSTDLGRRVDGVTGYAAWVPANVSAKLYLSKNFDIQCYKLWTVDTYTGERTYEGIISTQEVTHISLTIVRVV